MISQLTGKIIQAERRKKDSIALVDIHGVVYEIFIPSGLVDEIKEKINHAKKNNTDGILTFYTVHYIEGGMGGGPLTPRLIGFLDPLDRDFFELFTSVSGFGVRTALKAMVVPINEIARSIENSDEIRLDQLPEIGLSTAKKIIAELKGKMAKFALMKESKPLTSKSQVSIDMKEEALAVLMQLQYSKAESERLIEKAFMKNKKIKDSEELISEIFKTVGGDLSPNQ